MAGGHGWGGASQRVFQPPGAGLAPALPLLISGGEFLAHAYDATYKKGQHEFDQKESVKRACQSTFHNVVFFRFCLERL
jgi:hypothetical protein